MRLDLSELGAFGRQADKLQFPLIDVGGFIVPGSGPSPRRIPGKEQERYVGREGDGSEEAGSAAGPWQGRRAPSGAASRSAAQALGRRLSEELELEGLLEYYAARCVAGSSSSVVLGVPVGVFRSLPYRATLYLEIPRAGPRDRWWDEDSTFVPDVRAWAMWQDGVLVKGFHQYPDRSICAYMRGEWIWGLDPLHDLVDWCVCWPAKVLHLQFFDRWPGRHHCSAKVRYMRNKPDEYCGCGGTERYRDCCMVEDSWLSPYARFMEERQAADAYLREVDRRGLTRTLPWLPPTTARAA